jgi:hypothetical protein
MSARMGEAGSAICAEGAAAAVDQLRPRLARGLELLVAPPRRLAPRPLAGGGGASPPSSPGQSLLQCPGRPHLKQAPFLPAVEDLPPRLLRPPLVALDVGAPLFLEGQSRDQWPESLQMKHCPPPPPPSSSPASASSTSISGRASERLKRRAPSEGPALSSFGQEEDQWPLSHVASAGDVTTWR